MKYPFHTALLLFFFAGIIVTAVYDDVIYPMDDGVISIGMVLLFALTLGTLITRVNRAEQKKRAARKQKLSP